MSENNIKFDEVKKVYTVVLDDAGKFYAIRDKTPIFCFEGNSFEELAIKVTKAFEFYEKASD